MKKSQIWQTTKKLDFKSLGGNNNYNNAKTKLAIIKIRTFNADDRVGQDQTKLLSTVLSNP